MLKHKLFSQSDQFVTNNKATQNGEQSNKHRNTLVPIKVGCDINVAVPSARIVNNL